MADLTLPTHRLPGIEAVAREVLGLDPWACNAKGIALFPVWWPYDIDDDRRPGVPLSIPAGRLVAETWVGAASASGPDRWDMTAEERLHAACLYLGDLLTLCSALGVEVPAGTVPRLFADDGPDGEGRVWVLDVMIGDSIRAWHWSGVDGLADHVPALAGIDSPRAALDAIVREVCGG